MKFFLQTFILVLTITSHHMVAKELVFAIVPKDSHEYFENSRRGCMDAARLIKVICLYRSPNQADARQQDSIISQLVAEKVDGIAVAVTQSEFIAKHSIQKALKAGIPVITFDADFNLATRVKYPNIRLAYIGSNNFELGMALGLQLKKLRPQGGNLVIQTGRPDSPNLNQRVMGLRAALSGKNYPVAPGEPLVNSNGWTEVRTPYSSYGRIKRAAKQMQAAFKTPYFKIDAFVAVGGWAQYSREYRQMIYPFKDKLVQNEITVVMADTLDVQLGLLQEHLSHANIGQNPYQMGSEAILTLAKIVNNKPYEQLIYTSLTYCTPLNYATCTNPSVTAATDSPH